MSLMSRLLQREYNLPAPLTRRLRVQKDLRIPMRDGAMLLADHLAPREGAASLPTALIRIPYGRRSLEGRTIARPLAERGFQVLIVSCRGTFGSGDEMDPFRQEREDGLDVIDWVLAQPWFGDSMVLAGLSYYGYTQWAVADALPPQVKAMTPVVSEAAMSKEFMRRDGFSLEVMIEWSALVATQERPLAELRRLVWFKRWQRAMRTLPLRDADKAAFGHHWSYVQDLLRFGPDDPHWDRLDHAAAVKDTRAPASLVGGWFDIFLPGQVRDFAALQDAGRPARLTVGPWQHNDAVGPAITEALDFALPLARGEEPAERAPVRLYVMGAESWHDFESWPPEGYEPQRLHLAPAGKLAAEPEEGVDRYRYDPADPTPAAGGVSLIGGGRVDNTQLEARSDVLVYTTEVLDEDVEVVGNVSAAVWFRSSLSYADVFVRLCDVDEQGRSWNVCDGLTGVQGTNELTEVAIRLWPTAYRFKCGHRIRVQVSSGAFPRYARNPGTGEPLGDAVELRAADQEVHYTAECPSAIILPVKSA